MPKESVKRSAKATSPVMDENAKNPRVSIMEEMDSTDPSSELKMLDQKIATLMAKRNPSIMDSMQLTSLTLRREGLHNQLVVIPEVVDTLLRVRMNELFSEGGAARIAIEEEVMVAASKMAEKIEALEKELEEVKKAANSEIRQPRKWNKILANERARCIEASGKGIVVFEQEVLPGESAGMNDEQLEAIVQEVVRGEEVVGWKRLIRGKKALQQWKGAKPPAISIRLRTHEAREAVVRRGKEEKSFNVKREIPDLLMDEFKELEREAAKRRKDEGCQTYIGFAGSDIFLRQRKDQRDQWKTVKRL